MHHVGVHRAHKVLAFRFVKDYLLKLVRLTKLRKLLYLLLVLFIDDELIVFVRPSPLFPDDALAYLLLDFVDRPVVG